MREEIVPSPFVLATLHRAQAEAEKGRLWRAREIFQGSLSHESHVLEPEFLEAYGVLLNELGDRFQAGKYLFLSGRRHEVYTEAISLFLDRNSRTHINDLIRQFPALIRRQGLGHLSENVRKELEVRGANLKDLKRRQERSSDSSSPSWGERYGLWVMGGMLILLLITASVGFITMVGWLF